MNIKTKVSQLRKKLSIAGSEETYNMLCCLWALSQIELNQSLPQIKTTIEIVEKEQLFKDVKFFAEDILCAYFRLVKKKDQNPNNKNLGSYLRLSQYLWKFRAIYLKKNTCFIVNINETNKYISTKQLNTIAILTLLIFVE